jgi:hypothetical protein
LLLLFGNIINAKAKAMLDNPIEYITLDFLLFMFTCKLYEMTDNTIMKYFHSLKVFDF